jgi:hypothetical protein
MNRERYATGETSLVSKPASKPKPGKIQRASDPLFQIQQTIGNQALVQMFRAKSMQAKLTVGQPGDTYEQEADRVADQVMRMPDPSVQRKSPEEDETLQASPLTNTSIPQIQRQSPEEEELQASPLAGTITPMIQRQSPEEDETLQTKADSGMESTVDASLEGNINNLRGGGQPLPESVRNYFEPRFGYDFSQVRVHNDSRAADSAQAVNAKAFTLGQDVVFNNGQYAPEHEEGKKLIAHELTHVVQQNGQ